MLFVTFAVYKFGNLRNQLLSNRLLFSTLFGALIQFVRTGPAGRRADGASLQMDVSYLPTENCLWPNLPCSTKMTSLVESSSVGLAGK